MSTYRFFSCTILINSKVFGTCRFTSVFAVFNSSETCRFPFDGWEAGSCCRCAPAGGVGRRPCVLFVDPACVLGCDLAWVLGGERTHSEVAGSRCGSDATVWRLLGKWKQWCDLAWVLGGPAISRGCWPAGKLTRRWQRCDGQRCPAGAVGARGHDS
jgi:hypothetical protein